MEHNFENIIEEKKLGGGIITLAVLTFLGTAYTLYSGIRNLMSLDSINKTLESAGFAAISSSQIVIGIIVAIVSAVGFVLILLWKKLGVYIYYASFVLNLIVSVIFASANNVQGIMVVFMYVGIAVGFIIPVLLGIFLRKRFKYFT
ncbi:MAG: hypothetical protein ABRQ27_08335 [Clostridiaceae bacterium]